MSAISFAFFIDPTRTSCWRETLNNDGFTVIDDPIRLPSINYDSFTFIGWLQSDLGQHRTDVQDWCADGLLLQIYFNIKSDREILPARIGPLFPVPVPLNPKYA